MTAPRQRSLWLATATPAVALLPLDGVAEAEVAIIGAGYTGLSTALALAERGVAVTVLEAEAPGAAASGANGGQVIPGLKHFVPDLVKDFGEVLGPRLHEAGARDADALFALIERLGIECEATRAGWLQVADNPVALEECRQRCRAWAEWGAPTRMLGAEEVRAITGAAGYLGGWIDERGGACSRCRWRAAWRGRAGGGGAHPCAIARHRHPPRWRGLAAGDASGALRARRVLLATNARRARCARGWRIPSWRSGPSRRRPRPLRGCCRAGRWCRIRAACCATGGGCLGRLVVGGRARCGRRAGRDPSPCRTDAARLYPALPDQPPAFWWGGRVGITPDRLPRLFRLAEGVFAVMQDNGKGVAWCTAAGPALADLLAGAPAEDLPLPPATPLRPIPLHPFRSVYAAAGSLYFRARDALDRARSA